jgi:hypothetical protein
MEWPKPLVFNRPPDAFLEQAFATGGLERLRLQGVDLFVPFEIRA